jgi:hypothetical protein
VRDLVLLRKIGGRNRIQARKIAVVALMLLQYGGGRVIIEAIVITIIPDCGCTLRMSQKIGLLVLFEQRVLRREPRGGGVRCRAGGNAITGG